MIETFRTVLVILNLALFVWLSFRISKYERRLWELDDYKRDLAAYERRLRRREDYLNIWGKDDE